MELKEHKTRIEVNDKLPEHAVYRYRAACSCGWCNPQTDLRGLSRPDAETSARWHACIYDGRYQEVSE